MSPSALGEPRVSRLTYDARSGRFDADIDLPTSAASHGTLRLGGRAVATREVVVLAHAVERGAVLRDSDIDVERRPRAEVGREAITDRDRVIGLAARENLQAGRLVRSIDLMRPEVVQRNETVTLVYEMPGVMLTVRGGGPGPTICLVPKVRRLPLPEARRRLARAGCRVRVVSVSSRLKHRRVSHTLPAAGTWTIRPVVVAVARS